MCIRDRAFRGSEKHEVFGSRKNGNFLGILEFLAEYDDFLKVHIQNYGNPGQGKVDYLSKTICNEFIEIMYNKIVSTIVEELNQANTIPLL